jgi:deoxyhypusine monooxygenase
MLDNATADQLGIVLANESAPIAQRMRCCFLLKSMKSAEAVEALSLGMKSASVLLKHEIMYVMGQMGLVCAEPVLERVLRDENEDPVVRHEAAEAIGAIGSVERLGLLDEFRNSSVKEVAETCQIAYDRLNYVKEYGKNGGGEESAYCSVDPAPPAKIRSLEELEEVLIDQKGKYSLFERYKAMFALRNLGTNEAVSVLVKGFQDSSAVFRHEIAFVLGQMQNTFAIPALKEMLLKDGEHEMVRHEAAEALGAMADESTLKLLEEFRSHPQKIVSESCDVALDIHDYWVN